MADTGQDVGFDDLAVGDSFESVRRTLTEADIVSFSAITGDYSPLHADEVFVRESTDLSGRIAQGWLLVTIQSGLRSQIDRWKILAYLEMERAFRAPAYPGTTIHVRYRVEDLRRSASKPDRGVVTLSCEIVADDGTVLADGFEKFMLAGTEAG